MTPYGFARMECANLSADGDCLMVLAPEPHDYSLPLPDWPPPARRAQMVGQARRERRKMIVARCPEGRQLDLYYCPDCGEPLATRKRCCPACLRRRRQAAGRGARGRHRTMALATL